MSQTADAFATFDATAADTDRSHTRQDAIGRTEDALLILHESVAGNPSAPPERVALGQLARQLHDHPIGREELFIAAARLQADPPEHGDPDATLLAAFAFCDGFWGR